MILNTISNHKQTIVRSIFAFMFILTAVQCSKDDDHDHDDHDDHDHAALVVKHEANLA